MQLIVWLAPIVLLGQAAGPVIKSGSLYPASEHAKPRDLSPYSVFHDLLDDQLGRIQVKLTYVGPRLNSGPPIAFTTKGDSVDLTRFRPFYRKHVLYYDDYEQPTVIPLIKQRCALY